MIDMIKLDMIVLINEIFIEFSDNYYFKVNGKPLYKPVTFPQIKKDLKIDSKKYYDNEKYFKYLKRLYSLAILNTDKKKLIF